MSLAALVRLADLPEPRVRVLLLSWIAAIVACLAYGVATVLQSVGARRAAAATGVGGVVGIVTQVPYLAGLALDGVGFLGNVVALRSCRCSWSSRSWRQASG